MLFTPSTQLYFHLSTKPKTTLFIRTFFETVIMIFIDKLQVLAYYTRFYKVTDETDFMHLQNTICILKQIYYNLASVKTQKL